MAETAQVEIPNRALFKAAEVCELVKLQPYVLRSWESEFPDLGIAKIAGGLRVYRRADVERVLRIKHLLLVEGLTLAGARRRLEEETAPVAANAPSIDVLIGQNARERLTDVKRGLRSILDLLENGGDEFRLAPPSAAKGRTASHHHVRAMPVSKTARGKVSSRNGSARAPHARRKRPA
jgi:DNA-binding transcriptional MerR regulator